MKCLKCDSTNFEIKNIRFSSELKGETVDVIVPSFVCKACHATLMDAKQMNAYRRAVGDAYRKKHKLLTSHEIIDYRSKLNMNQAEFARYLNVGEASIKRWETYYIQDASQDDHIRLKCDEAYAETNFLNIQSQHSVPDEFRGNRKFSLELFKNVALFLIEKTQSSILFLNKLHFYADFLHFRKTGRGITGVRYVPLKYGPCPDDYKPLYDSLIAIGAIERKDLHCFLALETFNPSVFDDEEKATLLFLAEIVEKKGVRYLYDLSHKEKGFTETAECDFISYQFANELKIITIDNEYF